MKVLNIVSAGYRATLEEQDDTVIWLTHMLKKAGAEIDVLLRGSASNYVIEGQTVAPLTVGERVQLCGPDVHGQTRGLAEAGVKIYVLEADLKSRGADNSPRLEQAQLLSSAELPGLLSQYDQVWHW